MKRWVLATVIVVALVLGGLGTAALIRSRQASSLTEFQTVKAARGSLTATVGATGSVRASQSASLAFDTTGVVESLTASVGDQIAEGSVLASLEEESLSAQVILARADLISAQNALDELYDLAQKISAKSKLDLENARDELQAAEFNWMWMIEGPGANSLELALEAAEASVAVAQDRVKAARSVFNRVKGRSEDDAFRAQALLSLTNAKQQRDDALRELEWQNNLSDEQQRAVLDAELAFARARFEEAESEWERVKDGPDPKDIAAAQARIDAARATLGTATITAPFAGMVTYLDVQVRDLVSPGVPVIGLADFSKMLVEVEVSEVDINRLTVGQPVTLTLDAVPDRSYTGEVTEIGQIGTVVQGVVNFQVTVHITDPDTAIKPGMTAAVNVVVNQIDDVLLVPNRAVRVRDGERVVYVLRGDTPERVPVELGASSDIYSEVTGGGLEVGDLVILNPPLDLEHPGFVGRGPFR